MTARFGVLGPLHVTDRDGRVLRLRGVRQRSLLAVLLFNANRPVPAERLVDALWDGVPPKSYASNLHTYVSRLRERLGQDTIDHSGAGYRLLVAEDELDLLVFRAEADRGRAALRAGDHAAAATHLRAALAQWRDHPLADLPLPALDTEVARLETEHLAVFEDCAEAELATGRAAELIGELQAATEAHPLRERLVGLLMTALARAGRQVDALAVYRDVRATLVEETGLEPGAELRAAHTAVLRGEEAAPEEPWPVRQLPAEVPDFSGREDTVAELTALLGERRAPVVVLSGEPGVGKSTLAVRVAHRLRAAFPDGQLFAHLAGATAPRAVGDVLTDLLKTLGVPGPSIPDDLHAKAAVLRSRLAGRRVLLVLDDAADPAQVRPLLPGTEESAVLVTSRRRLSGLVAAHRVTVASLTDAEARQLLERIAGARVVGEPDGAGRIAAACGNLPLALRIAGTRLAVRPERLAALADRLEDERRRLDELTVSDLQVRSSLALSYAALSEPARTTFRLIGAVDLGDLPAWTITVLRDEPDTDAAVDELVESSLLQPAGLDGCDEPRYRMHDLVLAYARELAFAEDRLAERGCAGQRLVEAALALTSLLGDRLPAAFPPLGDAQPPPAPTVPADTVRRVLANPVAWFAAERRTLVMSVAALTDVGAHEVAASILAGFARYLWLHGCYADLRTCAETVAAGARAAGDERVETWAEAVLARVLHVRGHYTGAVAKYRWCAERWSEPADRAALAWVLTNLAECLVGLGVPDEALRLTERAAELSPEESPALLRVRSAVLNRLGRPAEAVRLDTDALAVARRAAEPREVAQALQSLSWSLALTGELDRAAAAATEAVVLLRGTAARSSLARSLRTLGAIEAGRGQRTRAVAAFAEGRAIAEAINEQPRVLSCRRAIAASWVGAGRALEAVAELRACLRAYREMGSVSSAAVTLRLLASAHEAAGETAAAAEARAEAARITDPRDANANTLAELLLTLTRPAGAGPPRNPAPVGGHPFVLV